LVLRTGSALTAYRGGDRHRPYTADHHARGSTCAVLPLQLPVQPRRPTHQVHRTQPGAARGATVYPMPRANRLLHPQLDLGIRAVLVLTSHPGPD
jgi:hypothetical protein